jgi:hypothetical protein
MTTTTPKLKSGDFVRFKDVEGYAHDPKAYRIVEGPYRHRLNGKGRFAVAYTVEVNGTPKIAHANTLLKAAMPRGPLFLSLTVDQLARIVGALRRTGIDGDVVDALTDRHALEQAGATDEQIDEIVEGVR